MSRLLDLAKRDLADAQDNLYRAQLAAKSSDVSKEWGRSGQTLQQIIDGYPDWVQKAKATVAQAEAMEATINVR